MVINGAFYLTVHEIALQQGITKQAIFNALRDGKLNSFKAGYQLLIPLDSSYVTWTQRKRRRRRGR